MGGPGFKHNERPTVLEIVSIAPVKRLHLVLESHRKVISLATAHVLG